MCAQLLPDGCSLMLEEWVERKFRNVNLGTGRLPVSSFTWLSSPRLLSFFFFLRAIVEFLGKGDEK